MADSFASNHFPARDAPSELYMYNINDYGGGDFVNIFRHEKFIVGEFNSQHAKARTPGRKPLN